MKTSFTFGERLWLSPDFLAVLFCALLCKVLQVNCACWSHLRIKLIEKVSGTAVSTVEVLPSPVKLWGHPACWI